jgi:hypothetical protein
VCVCVCVCVCFEGDCLQVSAEMVFQRIRENCRAQQRHEWIRKRSGLPAVDKRLYVKEEMENSQSFAKYDGCEHSIMFRRQHMDIEAWIYLQPDVQGVYFLAAL